MEKQIKQALLELNPRVQEVKPKVNIKEGVVSINLRFLLLIGWKRMLQVKKLGKKKIVNNPVNNHSNNLIIWLLKREKIKKRDVV